jgi:two-component system, NarL family, nitrate/nitrite response regulator NarL
VALRRPLAGEVAPIIDVFLIATTRFYREGLADALGRVAEIRVVGTATAAGEAISRVERLAPDVVLLDTGVVNMLDVLRTLTGTRLKATVIALALPERASDVLACAEAGASGYVTEDASLMDLVATINGVVRGEMRCSAEITGTLFRRIAVLAAAHPAFVHTPILTVREREVLALLNEGLSNKQIAHRLFIQLATVKNHVHHILEKLQVERRGEAIAYLRRQHQTGHGLGDLRGHPRKLPA